MKPSDGPHAVVYVNEQIEKAKEEAEPLAVHYSQFMGVICDELNDDWEEGEVTSLSKRTIRELERRSDEISAKFRPKPEELRHWIPMHSCHFVGWFGRDLAKACDGSNWQVVCGNRHTTVVDFATGRIFDVSLSETETAKQLIDFVTLNQIGDVTSRSGHTRN
jgi:hypothetical protein